MSYSQTISLFSERQQVNQRPTSFLVSLVAHAVAVSILSFGIIYTPEFRDPVVTRRYTVRHLDMHTPEQKTSASAAQGMAYQGAHSDVPKPAPGKRPASARSVMRQTANADKGVQTLIQPDLIEPLKLTELTPVPTVVIWTPKIEELKQVVAPLPEKATAADVKPSINKPTPELDLADLGVSATEIPTEKLAVMPVSTSPLEVHGPKMVQLPPVTASQTTAPPTPTAVMSISDLRMPDGTATLPPVNQTVAQSSSGILAPGNPSTGNASNQTGGKGTEQAAGGAGTANGANPAGGTKPGTAPGVDDDLTTQQFTLPKNGEFGAVIVGASLQEKFPEMSGIWNDRVAYTVYLHVGLAKSWIMQYSLPRTDEAAHAGNMVRLEAPWPYNIVRPNLPPTAFNADAILVHGYVNQQGKFEALALSFPPDFRQAQFVLDALNQWQFRPAEQNGQSEKVEVLLIIPEERD